MSTFSPRNGTPSASSSARWRAPLASEPSARTIRHHGRSGSWSLCSTGAGEARRAGGDVPVGADEALGRLPNPREHGGRPRVCAIRHGTYSIVALDQRTGELGVAVQSHWFSVGPLCAWARAGVGAVATQSVVEPAYGPARARPPLRARRRPAGARRAAGRRPAGGGPPGRGDRRARDGRRPHRRRLHRPRRSRRRRALRAVRPT